MSGGTKAKNKKMQDKQEKEGPTQSATNEDKNTENGGDGTDEALQVGLKSISTQISNLRTELKADFTTFKEEFKRDMKKELTDFKQEINQQLTANTQAIQDQNKKLEEAATRIEELETRSPAANNLLQQTLKEQKTLVDKLNDLESRSRGNNMWVYGVPEEAEDSAQKRAANPRND